MTEGDSSDHAFHNQPDLGWVGPVASHGCGAEALVAQNNAYGPSEAVMALAIFLISIVMLKGVFPRWVAWLGMLALPAALIDGMLKSTLGIVYLWWWAIAVIWFIAVGFKFSQLGWSDTENAR